MSNLLNLVDIFESYPYNTLSRIVSNAVTPAINVKEFSKNYKISLTAVGVDPKQIKVQLQDNVLMISYDHGDEKNSEEDGKPISTEYKHYSFSRSITLPKNVNPDTITAISKNGILHVVIDKMPEITPKLIEVQVKEPTPHVM
jgi:HSP20 family protein